MPVPVCGSSSKVRVMTYFDELKRSMRFLAQDPRTIFIGQAVAAAGTAMTNTLKEVPRDRLIELPVAEEMQMGMTTGMALTGLVPVSIFPRWNFLLCAISQLVNHLDKVQVMSSNGYKTKAITRHILQRIGHGGPGRRHRLPDKDRARILRQECH